MNQDRPVPVQVIVRCTNPACGLRYPTPIDDARRGSCVLCEAPTDDVEPIPTPHIPPASGSELGSTVGVLDNIRSALNVGAMLRTADGARVDHLHLCGLTPAGDHPKVAKSSLGAEDLVPWTHHVDAVVCVEALQADGFAVWALESTPSAVSFDEVGQAPTKLALIVGNERAGVDPALLRLAERHVHLPMAGAKTSLNVGVAFGIGVYGVRRLRSANH